MTKLNYKLKTLKTQEYVNGIAKEDKIHFLDFIRENFWDRPIKEEKVQKNIQRRVDQRKKPIFKDQNTEIHSAQKVSGNKGLNHNSVDPTAAYFTTTGEIDSIFPSHLSISKKDNGIN